VKQKLKKNLKETRWEVLSLSKDIATRWLECFSWTTRSKQPNFMFNQSALC